MSLAAASVFAPFIEYLRPIRSPHLLMAIFGVIAISITANSFNGKPEWLMMLTPQFLALIIFTLFAYFGKDAIDGNSVNIDDQLRFSRAFCITTSLMCLAMGTKNVVEYSLLFNLIYYSCLLQLLVFSIYTAARLFREESPSEFNYFQFATITSVFLIGATFLVTQINAYDGSIIDNYTYITNDGVEVKKSYFDLHLITGIFVYLLWLACLKFWISRVLAVIQVRVIDL